MSGQKTFVLRSLHAFAVPISAKTVWIIVELAFEGGPSGWGEATLSGSEDAVLAEVGHANTLLADRAFAGPAEAVATMRMVDAFQPRTAVMRAVEQAFYDAMGRWTGMPLAVVLGGPERRRIPVYANVNRGIADRSPAGFAARAREVVSEEGYRAVKIAPFDGLDWSHSDHATATRLLSTGIERVAATREAIGRDVALLVDCHSRLSPVMTRTVLRELEGAGLFWLEEPLAEHIFDARTARALRGFANDRGVRIAGGEHLATMQEARDFLARGDCDAILPDLRWTGIRTGMAILELAAASGVDVSLHNPAGPVLDRLSIQVAAALPSFLILERQVRESPLFDALRGAPETLSDGTLMLPAEPGFGPEPDREVLARCTCRNLSRAPILGGIVGAGGET